MKSQRPALAQILSEPGDIGYLSLPLYIFDGTLLCLPCNMTEEIGKDKPLLPVKEQLDQVFVEFLMTE